MEYRIVWSKVAGVELTNIIFHISEHSGKSAARTFYNRIKRKVESIALFPKKGRVVPVLRSIGITDIHHTRRQAEYRRGFIQQNYRRKIDLTEKTYGGRAPAAPPGLMLFILIA